MKGKFGTKTIVIIALTVVLLAIGITGTVLFLKDSGEASAMEETNKLPVTGLNNNQQTEENQEVANQNQTSEVTQTNTQPAQSNTNAITQNGTNTGTNITTPTQSTREITQEPETSTVEREKVIAESTELNWNKFNLPAEDYTEKDINYNNLKYKVEYYFDEELDEELTETVLKNKKGQIIDTYNDKVKQGYGLEKTENLPLTISEIEENNVIKVYYAKQRFSVEKTATIYKAEANKEKVNARSIIEEAELGDIIHYVVTVTNTGKVDIKGIQVTDTMKSDTVFVDVNVGETKTAFEYDYEVTQKDMDAQKPIYNKATAKIDDNNVQEVEKETEVAEADNSIEVIKTSELVKAEGNELKGKAQVKDKIDYAVKVKNIGNVTLEKIIINDSMLGITNQEKVVNLKPEEETIIELGSYEVKPADVDKQEKIYNTVTVNTTEGTDKGTDIIDTFKYVVNYYKDSITEANFIEKEEETAKFGSTVTADVTIHIPEGYKFVGTAPSTEITTGENIINVVYVKDSFGYRVNYYKDSIAEANFIEKEEGTAEFGSTVTADVTIHIPDGYKFEGTAPSIEITTGENVINVVYVKRTDLSYLVRYYYNGQEIVDNREEVPNQTFGAVITAEQITQKATYNNETYELKEYTTEQEDKKLPLIIQTNTALNVINVYYVKPIIEVNKTSKAYKANNGAEIVGTNVHEKDEIEYKITINNRGLGDTENITITDSIDLTKLEIKKIIIDNNEQQIPQNGIVTWSGKVPAASQQTIVIRVSVKTLPKDSNGVTINKNKVYLNGNTQNPIEDPNEYTVLKANINTEKSSKAYTSSNVEIQKTEPKTKLHVGDLIEYTIKVWNTGNEGTTVTIKDEAPEGTIYKEGDLTKEIYVPANTEYKDAKTMTFKVEVTQDGLGKTIKNIATVEETNGDKKEPKDPTEYVVIGYSDIVVTKTIEDKYKTVKYGDNIEYVITAENKGEEAGNVIIKDEDLQANVNNGNLVVKSITAPGKSITTSQLATGVEFNVLPDSKVQIRVVATAKAPIGSIISNRVKYVPDGKDEKITPAVETKVETEVTATNLVGQKTNIVILYDRSASMWEGGKDDKAKKATCDFIDSVFNKEGAVGNTTISVIGFTDEMGDPEVGIVKFGNNLSTATTISEKEQLKKAIKGLSSDGDYTYIKPGLDIAKQLIPTLPNYSTANNMIVIMTDGKFYDVELDREYSYSEPSGIEGEAVPSRDALKRMGVKIYAVGFGLSYLSSDYNAEEEQEAKDILRFFADKSYTAETQNELLNSYKNILLEASVSNMLSSDGKININLGDKIKNIKIYKNGAQLNATFKVNYSGNNATVTTTATQYKEIAGDITIKNNVLTWDLSGTLYKDWNSIKITYEY